MKEYGGEGDGDPTKDCNYAVKLKGVPTCFKDNIDGFVEQIEKHYHVHAIKPYDFFFSGDGGTY